MKNLPRDKHVLSLWWFAGDDDDGVDDLMMTVVTMVLMISDQIRNVIVFSQRINSS